MVDVLGANSINNKFSGSDDVAFQARPGCINSCRFTYFEYNALLGNRILE